jgi:ribonuclease P protein component
MKTGHEGKHSSPQPLPNTCTARFEFARLFLTVVSGLISFPAPFPGCFLTLGHGDQPCGPVLNCYEETISTVENPPQTAARVLESQFEQERQSYSSQSPPRGTQTLNPSLTLANRGMAAATPKRLRFARSARIKQARDFRKVRERGDRLTIGCLIANWSQLEPAQLSRLGVITSSRIGGAVVRNRARRLMRECFRLHQHLLTRPVDLVLVARKSIVEKDFSGVERDFLTTLRKAGLLKTLNGK